LETGAEETHASITGVEAEPTSDSAAGMTAKAAATSDANTSPIPPLPLRTAAMVAYRRHASARAVKL
jgi:hypothetical protein